MSQAWRVAWAVVALGLGLVGGAAETVCPEGCTHAEVQDAVAAAQPGATVLIHPGTYRGDLWVRKAVDLRGEGPDPVVIAGMVYVLGTTQVTLHGLTVREGGIQVEDSSGVLISRCAVEGPGGIVIRSSSVTLRTTAVQGSAAHGILVTLGSRALIADSAVRDCAGHEIHVAASMADIRGCEVHGSAGTAFGPTGTQRSPGRLPSPRWWGTPGARWWGTPGARWWGTPGPWIASRRPRPSH